MASNRKDCKEARRTFLEHNNKQQFELDSDHMLLFDFDESDFRETRNTSKSLGDLNLSRSVDVICDDNEVENDCRGRQRLSPVTISDDEAFNELTLENLKTLFSTCFTCGVNWRDEHVSLGCLECGGYSLRRPCPQCEGECRREWNRDVSRSHDLNKAQWQGECGICSEQKSLNEYMADLMLTSS